MIIKIIKETENNHEYIDDLSLEDILNSKLRIPDLDLFIRNNLLYELLSDFSTGNSIPTPYLLGCIITTISGSIGKNVVINLNDSKSIYLNLWTILIGQSATSKKSSAIEEVTEALLDIDSELYKEYNYQQSLQQSESSEFEVPKYERIIFHGNTSYEGLMKGLATSSRGILIEDEFGSLLQQSRKKYASDLKLNLTKIYTNPRTLGQDRSDEANSILVERPYLSLLGASVKEMVFMNADQSDFISGFFARVNFIYLEENSKPYIPLVYFKADSQHNPKEKLREILYRVITNKNKVELKLSSGAIGCHAEFDQELEVQLHSSSNEFERVIIERMKANALKISGIIAVMNSRQEIDLADMEDAITITRYFMESSLKFAEEFHSTPNAYYAGKDQSEKVLQAIKNAGGKIKRAVLLQNTKLRKEVLNNVLEKLIEQNVVIECQEDVGNSNLKKITFYKIRDN